MNENTQYVLRTSEAQRDGIQGVAVGGRRGFYPMYSSPQDWVPHEMPGSPESDIRQMVSVGVSTEVYQEAETEDGLFAYMWSVFKDMSEM